jgi:hypothetical protein
MDLERDKKLYLSPSLIRDENGSHLAALAANQLRKFYAERVTLATTIFRAYKVMRAACLTEKILPRREMECQRIFSLVV